MLHGLGREYGATTGRARRCGSCATRAGIGSRAPGRRRPSPARWGPSRSTRRGRGPLVSVEAPSSDFLTAPGLDCPRQIPARLPAEWRNRPQSSRRRSFCSIRSKRGNWGRLRRPDRSGPAAAIWQSGPRSRSSEFLKRKNDIKCRCRVSKRDGFVGGKTLAFSRRERVYHCNMSVINVCYKFMDC